jgi:hypothetical protein
VKPNLAIVFGFLVVFGGALFLVRPDPTPAQGLFRLAVIAAGMAGLGVLHARGRRR